MSTMTPPLTWVDGVLMSAVVMNTYIRDGFLSMLGKLDSTSFTSSQASINFGSIPQTYSHLVLIGGYGSDTSAVNVGGRIAFNGDTSGIYHSHQIVSSGSAAVGTDIVNSSGLIGLGAAGNSDPKMESAGITIIPNYHSTNYKTVIGATFNIGSTAAGSFYTILPGGMWKSTAAITQITLKPTAGGFSHGGMSLYGIP